MLDEKLSKILQKQHYAIIGNHSALQICRWTKKSLIDEGFCYKEKFYGIKSHLCCQMSPFILCPNECVHCWRPIELTANQKIKSIDSPKEIVDNCILAQRKMLNGFGGNKKLNKTKFQEAQEPQQFALSLIGEPTLYPNLSGLIKELRKRGKTSFVVTNGLYPEKLLELKKEKSLPTQLYVSLNAPNKKLWEEWHKSRLKDAWKKFNKTLEILPKLDTRRVLRLTLVNDLNMIEPENYAKLIKKTDVDFIEVKGYMAVGFARKKLGYDRMPTHIEIKQFAKEILKFLPEYKFLDEKVWSKVVLLGKDKSRMKIQKHEF